MLNILYAFLVLGILGLLFGVVLALASKIFEVKTDERLDPIISALPGANCGACGYAGCAAYAQAIIDGEAEANKCSVGGDESLKQISAILGIELTKNKRLAAFVNCSGGINTTMKYQYMGLHDCHAAMRVAGGPVECIYGCVGLGSCVASCRFGAISIKDGIAFVDQSKCTGCLRCVNTCPKKVIRPVPYYADVNVACSSHDRGSTLRKICNIGCIGCRICEKYCEYDAIKVVDNLAEIDYDKCTGCGECVSKCPRNLISDSKLDRSEAEEEPSVS